MPVKFFIAIIDIILNQAYSRADKFASQRVNSSLNQRIEKMKRKFVNLHALVAICFVLSLQGCKNASSSGAEHNKPGATATTSSVVTTSSGSAKSSWSFVVFGDTRDTSRSTQTGISPLLGR